MANLTRYTIGQRIKDTGGFTSGFDYMRVVLALLVVLGHSLLVSGDDSGRSYVFPGIVDSIRSPGVLALFFALSGFLVSASLIRTKGLGTFLGLRALRIAPALCVEIVLSALILGPILTTSTLSAYFSSGDFYKYFFNTIGWIHYNLPGVFLNHPAGRQVNGSLWTVPYEAECYIALTLLAFVGLKKRPKTFLAAFCVMTILLCIYYLIHGDPDPSRSTATGRQLVLFFLSGVLLYLHRDHVPYSGKTFIVAAALSVALIRSHTLIYLAPFPVAYVVAYLGLTQPRKLPIVFTGDYSYGIYLYAYPMQQAAYQLFDVGRTWYGNFGLAVMAVCLFAAFSWHAIEKPALKLKRHIIQRANKLVSADELIAPDKTKESIAMGGNATISYKSTAE